MDMVLKKNTGNADILYMEAENEGKNIPKDIR